MGVVEHRHLARDRGWGGVGVRVKGRVGVRGRAGVGGWGRAGVRVRFGLG